MSNKKIITITVLGLLSLISAVLFLPSEKSVTQPNVLGATIGSCIRSGLTQINMTTSSATTSIQYLITGAASSTLSFETDGLTALNVSLEYYATSTVRSPLQIDRYVSDNNIDFFPYDNTRGVSSQVILASSTPLSWLPATTNATSTIVTKLDLIPARYTKLVFSLGTTTPMAIKTINDTIGFYANVVGSFCQP